jgi:Xaa-Pro aminopeptidase
MLLAGVDVLLILGNDIWFDMGMANLRYLTQIGSKTGAHGVFFLDRDPIVWNARPHSSRPTNMHLLTQEWVSDIRPVSGAADVAAAIRESGLGKGRIGLVGYGNAIVTTATLLHGDVLAYRTELPGFDFIDANWTVERARLIKSDEEIAMLVKAGAIARKTVDTMIAAARPGITEAGLFAKLIETQISNGAEPQIFHLLSSGPVEHPPLELWHLLHGSEQPAVPTMRPLADGDIVVTEFHTQYGGYLAATEFSVYVGRKAPQRLLDIHKVCVECLQASQEALRAGNTLRQAWDAIRYPAKKAGMEFVELGFHGHGMGSPEFPCVVYPLGFGPDTMNGYRIEEFVFEEGMVFGNNIDVFDPKWKPDVGCMFGDMMLVRKDGGQRLVNVPLELPQTGSW